MFSKNRAEVSSHTRLGRCADLRGQSLDGQSRSLLGRSAPGPSTSSATTVRLILLEQHAAYAPQPSVSGSGDSAHAGFAST